METRMGHIVSLSGGADSATVAGIAKDRHSREIAEGRESSFKVFHCNYGQRTQERELKSFNDICDFYGIPESDRIIIDISYLKQIGGSSLTDNSIDVDKTGIGIHSNKIPTSYVPGRNINLLAICSSIAAVHYSSDIWIGVVEQDSSGYPDCRASFIECMQSAINLGLPDGLDVVINTPLISLPKSEIIRIGMKIGVPYSLTWSCYESNDLACGECDSCKLRIKSFIENEVEDPITYKYDWATIKKMYRSWGI